MAEVMVASGLALLAMVLLGKTMANLNKAKLIQDEVSEQARSLRMLDSRLRTILGSSQLEGVHLSSNGQVISVQPIAQLSADGEQQWSPQTSVIVYDPASKTLILKSVPFAEAGIASTSLTPVTLSDEDLGKLSNATGEILAENPGVTAAKFQLDPDKASLFVNLHRELRHSRAHQDQPWLETAYGLRSSLALSASE